MIRSTYDGCVEAWLCRVAWFTNQGLVIKEARYLGDYPGAAVKKAHVCFTNRYTTL